MTVCYIIVHTIMSITSWKVLLRSSDRTTFAEICTDHCAMIMSSSPCSIHKSWFANTLNWISTSTICMLQLKCGDTRSFALSRRPPWRWGPSSFSSQYITVGSHPFWGGNTITDVHSDCVSSLKFKHAIFSVSTLSISHAFIPAQKSFDLMRRCFLQGRFNMVSAHSKSVWNSLPTNVKIMVIAPEISCRSGVLLTDVKVVSLAGF